MNDGADQSASGGSGPAGDALTGHSLGPYRVFRELGRGSNGVVYEAMRTDDDQRVALKVLPANITLNPKTITRFQREAQAAMGIEHDGIVQVLDIGEDNGTHFFAMEYVEGVSLDRYARSRDLSVGEAVRLIRDAARALHHAHQHGVVHRDVKPSNLLVRADGAILVSDFGLARLEKSQTLTSTDAIVGTPRYMSPEQILAEKGKVDQRTDVYALAVTLYELVTGDHPFEGDTVQSFLRNVLESDPEPPRKKNRLVPRSVETIILKAMERDLDRRYQTSEELADDLDRFLDRKPVRARRPPLIPRVVSFVRRHRVTVLLSALGFTGALVVIMAMVMKSGSVTTSYDVIVTDAATQLNEIVGWNVEDAPAKIRDLEVSLARAIRLRSRRPEAYLLRGHLRWHLSRFEDARSDLGAARDRGASELETATVRALLALTDQDWPRAIRISTFALDQGPTSATLLFIRGSARFAEGDAQGAKADLTACRKLNPDHQHAIKLQEELGRITGEDSEEVSNLAKFVDMLEQFGRAGAESAGALAAITELVSKAGSKNPKLLTIGRSLFHNLVLRQRPGVAKAEEAREEVAAATAEIEADPENPAPYSRRGRARIGLNQYADAILDFQTAIEKGNLRNDPNTPPDWEAHFWIAFVFATSPNEDLLDDLYAIGVAEVAVRLAPTEERARARDVEAEVRFRVGQKDAAIGIIRALIESDPDRAEYYRRREAYFES